MSRLMLPVTVPLCATSALVWNGLLLYAGYLLGQHWRVIADYLTTYSKIITSAIVVVLVVWFIYHQIKKRIHSSGHNG